jgi:hypothetical protein
LIPDRGREFCSLQNCPHLPWGHAVIGSEYLEVAFSGDMETMLKLRIYGALHSLKEGGSSANILAEVFLFMPVFCTSIAIT